MDIDLLLPIVVGTSLIRKAVRAALRGSVEAITGCLLDRTCWEARRPVNRRTNNELADFAAAQDLFEHTLCFMHIAPGPSRRRDSAHHWMLHVIEMFAGVLARRRVATADVATGSALAKSNPKRALSQALLAGIGSSLRREILGA